MIVQMRLDISDDVRRAVAHHVGDRRMATRREVVIELESVISAHIDDLMFDYEGKADELYPS